MKILTFMPEGNYCGEFQEDDVSATLTTRYHYGSGGDAALIVMAVDTTQITSPQNYSSPKPGDPCHPLCATAHVPLVVESFGYDSLNQSIVAEKQPPIRSVGGGDKVPVVIRSYGLDAYNQSIEEEVSQTVRTNAGGDNVAKTLQIIDMTHAQDVVRIYDDGTVPTLQHRMGTGGNKIPLVFEEQE